MLLGQQSNNGTTHSVYGTHTPYGRAFKPIRLYAYTHCTDPAEPVRKAPNNPAHATPAGSHTWNGLAIIRVRSPLLTESLLFSLPAGTEMFHFPAFPPRILCVQIRVTGSRKNAPGGVSPFGDPGITVRLSTTPGLSQIPTSFIGS